jgi:hypothetical protein
MLRSSVKEVIRRFGSDLMSTKTATAGAQGSNQIPQVIISVGDVHSSL